jgi:hypothetical protein
MPDIKNLKDYQKQYLLTKWKWIFDPAPPWLKLGQDKLKEKILGIEMEKIEALEKITGKIM